MYAIRSYYVQPILRLTQEYQLTSLADLFAFRYRSQLAGILVTLFMLLGTLPYIALQIRAVTDSMQVVSQSETPRSLALIFCVTLIVFAILFGARHSTSREKHRGLVAAIAFESAVKLLALLSIGITALIGVFGGTGWLMEVDATTGTKLPYAVFDTSGDKLVITSYSIHYTKLYESSVRPKARTTRSAGMRCSSTR